MKWIASGPVDWVHESKKTMMSCAYMYDTTNGWTNSTQGGGAMISAFAAKFRGIAIAVVAVLVLAIVLATAASGGPTSAEGPNGLTVTGGSSAAPSAATSARPANAVTGNTSITLTDGRSFTARSEPVDPNLGFSPYEDTGIGLPDEWKFTLPTGYTAIVGGVTVNDKDRGNLVAFKGPGAVHVYVVDGFYKVVPDARGEEEFCLRLAQHLREGWLVNYLQPLDGWTCGGKLPGASAVPSTKGAVTAPSAAPSASRANTVTGLPRRQTGAGGHDTFKRGEAVSGTTVKIGGVLVDPPPANCYIIAGGDGEVDNGVVNPWIGEHPPCP